MTISSSSSDYEAIVPTMVSNTSPAPFVISASDEKYAPAALAYQAFTTTPATACWVGSFGPAWLKVDCGLANEKVVNAYSLYENTNVYPMAWTFEGSNDDVLWDTLDTQTGQDTTTKTIYHFSNSTPYRYYRWYVTDVNGNGSTIEIKEAKLFFFDNNSSSSISSSSSSSSSSSKSSLYGYLLPPTNLRKVEVNPLTREVSIAWDWVNEPLATPQIPTGFTVERRIGSRDWELRTYSIPGDVFEFTETLTDRDAALIFVRGDDLAYKVTAYWVD